MRKGVILAIFLLMAAIVSVELRVATSFDTPKRPAKFMALFKVGQRFNWEDNRFGAIVAFTGADPDCTITEVQDDYIVLKTDEGAVCALPLHRIASVRLAGNPTHPYEIPTGTTTIIENRRIP